LEPRLLGGAGAKVWPTTKEQRCWVHKTANILDKLPKNKQAAAKAKIHQIWMAKTRKDATAAFDAFLEDYRAKNPKATECLQKDRDELLTFYDFPAEHWAYLRTTNPIESTFATMRLRHRRTKGNDTACLTMVFKLVQSAAKGWRLLNGSELLPDVIQGVVFQDGLRLQAAA
jgi:putative transposase